MTSSTPEQNDGLPGSYTFRLARNEAVNLLRRELGKQREDIRKAFEERKLNGVEAGHALAAAMDKVILHLTNYAGLDQSGLSEPFCFCATGSYGAGLLAPFSDIDLLFVTDNHPSPTLLKQIEYILYSLWDLGLKVGHATHSVKSCLLGAQNDQTMCTTLLYLRPLHGDTALADAIQTGLRAYLTGRPLIDFIKAKIREREIRHQRFGETPFLVEPNLKEGRGGLRDLQVLNWIGRASLEVLMPGRDLAHSALSLAPTCVKLGLLSPIKVTAPRKYGRFYGRYVFTFITSQAVMRNA